MSLRSSYGSFYRRAYFSFICIENVLSTSVESKLLWSLPSILRGWSLDCSLQSKEGSLLYSFEDREKSSSGLRSQRSSSALVDISKSASVGGWSVSSARIKSFAPEWRLSQRRTHMGHAHGHDEHESHEKLGAYGEKILRWGLWSDIILTISKAAAGYVSGSTAIIADAAHSASDIGLSGVALWCSKASKAPPDEQHPYGYGKIETVGALSISMLLLVTGGGIAWTAIDALQALIPVTSIAQDTITQATQEAHSHGHNHEHGLVAHTHAFDMEHMEVALFAAIAGIGAKEGLYWITYAAGEKSGSALLKANAWHHRGDAVSTIVALIGVGGAMMGMPLLDPVAALLVSGMIIKAGLKYGYQSMQELLDRGLPPSILAPIRETVLHVDGVKGIHVMRGRRMGSIVEVDVHVEVDPQLSVSAAGSIKNAVKQQVRTRHRNISESYVYVVPHGEHEVDEHHHGHHHDEHSHAKEHPHEHHAENKHGHGHKHDHDRDSHVEDDKNVACDVKRGNEGITDLNRVGQKLLAEIQANFGQVVKVRTVTCQRFQDKVIAEMGISLDPNLSIRDAMRKVSEMETFLIQNVEGLAAISMQLDLSSGTS